MTSNAFTPLPMPDMKRPLIKSIAHFFSGRSFRNEIIRRLLQRDCFPAASWSSLSDYNVEPVCRLIAEKMELPNHYFLPQDPSASIFSCEAEDFQLELTIKAVLDHFGLAVDCLPPASNIENRTLDHLISYLVAQQKDVGRACPVKKCQPASR